jgi:DNA invertase Pin-like site-specific DNA recombinase
METKYVAYYRVSTARQGASGLGLEAQREAVSRFLAGNGHKLVAEFTEVETGKGSDALDKRPQLREAIAVAKRQRASILIAKLDRLARNVHFISGLQETKVRFTAADMPEANEMVIHLMAAMAQHEARMISARTKAALAAKRARGEKLGNPHLLEHGNKTKARKARAFAGSLKTTLGAFQAQGMTQRAIVEELNTLGVSAPQGGSWHLIQLQRVLARL